MEDVSKWQGRIAFEKSLALFEGSTGDNRFHSHIAAQVVIGARCAIELSDGRVLRGSGIFIRPHVPHRLFPNSNVRVYLIEPASKPGRALLATMPLVDAALVQDGQALVDELVRADKVDPTDPRLRRAMKCLSGDHSFSWSMTRLAGEVGLSPARLRAIADRELGMPLSRWRRWSAIRRACMAMVDGQTPTQAAHLAGFSDQAHLTRAMRAMLGITPSAIARA